MQERHRNAHGQRSRFVFHSSDKLYGEDGNDRFYGNAGADILNGGLGIDTATANEDDSPASIEVIL